MRDENTSTGCFNKDIHLRMRVRVAGSHSITKAELVIRDSHSTRKNEKHKIKDKYLH